MLVRDVMTRPVVTVDPSTPVGAAAATLSARGFTALPVVDADRELVGIVTEADLLRGRVHHDVRSPLLRTELDATPPPVSVGEVMTVDVLTAQPLTDVADLVERMRRTGTRSVPVVSPGEGVVGIVSRRDVLHILARSDEMIAGDVRRKVETYAGRGRWEVSVDGGIVTLGDVCGDVREHHTVRMIAAAVPGVVDVRIAACSE